MSHAKKLIALLMALVMTATCALGTMASAASIADLLNSGNSTEKVSKATKSGKTKEQKITLQDRIYEDVDTDREATVTDKTIDYAADKDSGLSATMLYYDTTPWYYIPAIVEAAASSDADAQEITDLAVVVPASMGTAFTKAMVRNLSKTVSGIIEDEANNASDWGDKAYEYTGDAGRIVGYTAALAIGGTSNTALLLLLQGVVNVAIVIMVPITWIAIPLLGIQDGEFEMTRIIGQLDKLHDTVNK